MPTLFKALLSQHARTLKPMRYAEPMTAQLQTFFEEVVVENKLRALVVESLPLRPMRSMREIERIPHQQNCAVSLFSDFARRRLGKLVSQQPDDCARQNAGQSRDAAALTPRCHRRAFSGYRRHSFFRFANLG
jgi:hypothetical protein